VSSTKYNLNAEEWNGNLTKRWAKLRQSEAVEFAEVFFRLFLALALLVFVDLAIYGGPFVAKWGSSPIWRDNGFTLLPLKLSSTEKFQLNSVKELKTE
jgi:hypothetical protein